MKVRNTSNHCGTGDEMIAIGKQLPEQRLVFGVSLDKLKTGLTLMRLRSRSVFGKVIQPEDIVPRRQKFIDEITADKSTGTCDQNFHINPWAKIRTHPQPAVAVSNHDTPDDTLPKSGYRHAGGHLQAIPLHHQYKDRYTRHACIREKESF